MTCFWDVLAVVFAFAVPAIGMAVCLMTRDGDRYTLPLAPDAIHREFSQSYSPRGYAKATDEDEADAEAEDDDDDDDDDDGFDTCDDANIWTRA